MAAWRGSAGSTLPERSRRATVWLVCSSSPTMAHIGDAFELGVADLAVETLVLVVDLDTDTGIAHRLGDLFGVLVVAVGDGDDDDLGGGYLERQVAGGTLNKNAQEAFN